MNRAMYAGIVAIGMTVIPESAGAQESRRYVSVSAQADQLKSPAPEFSVDRAIHPAIAVGYLWKTGHSLEVSASHLEAESTEPRSMGAEAPYTLGVRATPVEIRYQYRRLRNSAVSPLVGVGFLLCSVTDRWSSDTPTESLRSAVWGVTGSAGIAARVAAGASGVVRAGFRRTSDTRARSVRHIGLNGYTMSAGIEFAL
jgi:outer membrane protein W